MGAMTDCAVENWRESEERRRAAVAAVALREMADSLATAVIYQMMLTTRINIK
jgi:hypothetical protein